MISVGSRDARKGLGLGFGGAGGGRREMEESELEEGEACSSQNHEDYDASIDPDVALSYIDEKIQDVLGHFQKDFEGGVSAENLGAKFGGYGSFLPTYPCSPVWSRPRTPPKIHIQNTPRSPNNVQLEAVQGDVVHSLAATQSLRHGPSAASSSRLPAVKAPSIDDAINLEKCMTTYSSEAVPSESANTKSTLKVRIIMGTDNLSTQKNAAIYSGLGLDVSPSSSLDDSPSDSEGISHEPRDVPCESPTSILQIMTSLPLLLSPLPDDFIQFTEKEAHAKGSIHVSVHMDDPESSSMVLHESNVAKGDRKLSRGKKIKSVEGYGSSIEVKSGTNMHATRNGIGVLSRNERGVDALTTEELVSKTLKLPLLSSSYSCSDDSLKGVDGPCDTLKEAEKGTSREKAFSDQARMERMEQTSIEVNGFVEKAKEGSGKKVVEDKVSNSIDDLSVYTLKDNPQGDKICDSIIAESNFVKGRAALNIEHIEPSNKAYQRGSFSEQDCMTLPVFQEHLFRGGKKKSKGLGTMATEREKETSRIGTSLVPKTTKSFDDSSTSKNEIEDVRVQKDSGKARDTYIDFFGELEEEEDRMDLLETPYEDKLKDSEVVERSTPGINCAVKEKSDGKKFDEPLTSEAYPGTATNLVRSSGCSAATDADTGRGFPITAPSVVTQDNWVQCDRCHKWRLLPVGTNPDSLPEKWLCSMLNWLPDMNRCSVSEDETTKALITWYQAPLPEGQINMQNVPRSVTLGGTLSTVQHPDQQQLNHSLPAMRGVKKKFVKEIANSANKDGSSQLSSSMKKNFQSSVKSRSLNDVNNSPAMSEPDIPVEKHKSKQKILEQQSDRGETKNLKVKSRRDPDQDRARPSKKGKTDGMHSTEGEWIPHQSGTTTKADHSSNNSFPATSAVKDRPKHKSRSSSRDSKYERKDRLQVSVEKTENKGWGSLANATMDLGKYDTVDSVKKRKLKEYRDTQTCSTGHHHLQESRVSVQELSDSMKEKKARMSKSEGRESITSKGSGRTDKKVSHTKSQKLRQDPGNTLPQRSLDGMDCLKRDLGPGQASAAATSSSSKVSGSHKTKTSFQEVKGSPVESVSSSPMRTLNTEKLTNGELIGKDDSHDAGVVGSTRRCSDGEDDGGSDRTGRAWKVHHRSNGSSMLDFQDKDVNNMSDIKSKAQTLPSPDITTSHFMNGGVDTVGQDGTYSSKEQLKDQCQGEDRTDVYFGNVSSSRKTGRVSSSHLKDNSQSCKSEFNAEKGKNTSSLSQLQDQSPSYEAKHRDGKVKLQAKFGIKSDKSETMHPGKKDYTGNESRKKENQSNRGHDFQEVSVDPICKQEAFSAPSRNQLLDSDAEKSSKRSLSLRADQEVLGKGKFLSLPPSGGAQTETSGCCPQPVVSVHKGNGDVAVDPSKVEDGSKLQKKQIRKADHQNGTQHISSRHPALNGHRSKELDAPSPVRRDSSSHAANNAVKEAKDLKHLADRLKNSGSTLESTGLYFQAALKFLHGASLLESGNNDSAKHNEMIQSKQMYSSTAKLCEFCAHEYEKLKDMAAAALAYKCVEVAYMRVIYSSHSNASRDRHELQMAPLGESPSSSASDVDNVNNSTTADKVALSKGVSSPQVAGTHVIAAQNRPNFGRLLNFAQDVNFAMEASRKSRIAFAAANSSSSKGKYAEGISSIKKALDFNFQDVEGLLRLVRLAMEAINR